MLYIPWVYYLLRSAYVTTITIFWEKAKTEKMKLTEIDEKSSISLPLIVRHGHDTADVVLLGAVLLLREVAHQVTPLGIVLKIK